MSLHEMSPGETGNDMQQGDPRFEIEPAVAVRASAHGAHAHSGERPRRPNRSRFNSESVFYTASRHIPLSFLETQSKP